MNKYIGGEGGGVGFQFPYQCKTTLDKYSQHKPILYKLVLYRPMSRHVIFSLH